MEKGGTYPAYESTDLKLADLRVTTTFTYRQMLEIANVFFVVNKVPIKGVVLDGTMRSLHKSIHDSAVNCVISLEEKNRLASGGPDVAA